MIEVQHYDATIDDQAVKQLLREQAMRFAGFELVYDRGSRFDQLLELQGPYSRTYLAKESGHIVGLISLSSSYRWINSALMPVCMIGDFRINGSRSIRKVWRTMGDKVLSDYSQSFHPGEQVHFFGAVLAGNQAARKNIVGSKRFAPYMMSEIGQLDMVNVFAGPFWHKTPSTNQVCFAGAQDQEELFHFLASESQKKFLGYNYSMQGANEWPRRQKEWAVGLQDFLILRQSGKIKACTLPWAPPESAKSMYYTKAPGLFEMGLKTLRRLGLQVPAREQNIKTLYLTHLHIANDLVPHDVLLQFIEAAKEKARAQQAQMISFADNWKCMDQFSFKSKMLAMRIGAVMVGVEKEGFKESWPAPGQAIELEMAVL